MKAARFYTAKDLRVDNVPDEAPKGDEVRIQVKWCGICGEHSVYGAAERFYAALSESNRAKLVGRALEMYDGDRRKEAA